MKLGKITQNSKQRPSACLCLAARSLQSFCTLYKMVSITLDRSIIYTFIVSRFTLIIRELKQQLERQQRQRERHLKINI